MFSILPLSASTYASEIDNLILFVSVIVGFWFFLVMGVFFWLLWRYRAKEGVPSQYVTGYDKEQKRFISIPHYLVLVCDVFILVGAIKVWYNVKQDLPPAEAEVRVIAQQWAWAFVHPGADGAFDTADDIKKVNELHLQKDTVYHYHLQSRDVLHSFSIPVFRLKQDALPGRTITGWFEPTRTGEFLLQCTEICGVGHALMPAKVFVEDAPTHALWIANNSNTELASN